MMWSLRRLRLLAQSVAWSWISAHLHTLSRWAEARAYVAAQRADRLK